MRKDCKDKIEKGGEAERRQLRRKKREGDEEGRRVRNEGSEEGKG